jgi:hypothetical protein
MCRFQEGKGKLVNSKKNDQCCNVYENKGPLWKTGGKSGNVYENKASYLAKAGKSLKTHGLSLRTVGCFPSLAALSS